MVGLKLIQINNYHNKENYLASARAHIPLYENLSHEKVLPHLITESLFCHDHYLSRTLIRDHIKTIRKESLLIRLKEIRLVIKGILKYFFQKREEDFYSKLNFFKKVIIVKEKKV